MNSRRERQRGQVLVIVVMGILGLIAATGLVIDGGRAFSTSRQLDAAAEAAAHAGAFKLQKAWDGASFGALTDTDVRAAAKNFASYNGWGQPTDYNGNFSGNQAGGQFYMAYLNGDGTTTNDYLTNNARGVTVQLSMPQQSTFLAAVGVGTYDIFARATAMFGSATSAPALPLAVNDDAFTPSTFCTPPTPCSAAGFQPASGPGVYGTFNFASIVPPGCIPNDLTCYLDAMAGTPRVPALPPIQIAKSYPANGFDKALLSAQTAAALQRRIDARPYETCTNFGTPSPRVVFLPIANGDIGGSSVYLIRFRAIFLTEVVPPNGFSGCFVRTTVSSGDFDPNAVGTGYGGVTIMKLVRNPNEVTPTSVSLISISSPNRPATGTPPVGTPATLSVRTTPNAFCTAIVRDATPSSAKGLGAVYSDSSGVATWKWLVDSAAPPGNWPVDVSCSYRALVGRMSTSLLVTA